jgi:zinc protease
MCALLLSCASVAQAALPIQTWTASSGALVLFVESHDLAMLDVSVELPAGSARDTPATSGLASLTLRLMRLGADSMDEDEIARRLADVGANLNASFDVDRAGYALRTLSSAAEQQEALAVLSRVLQAPSFPASVLEREKARVIAGLKEADTKPDIIASRTFSRLLFRDHPYALRTTGEPDTVSALTRDNVVDFYRSHYQGQRAVVAIMGDVTRQRAADIADQLTRDLPQVAAPLAALPPVKPLEAAIDSDIEHPSAQSHILIGQPGVARNDPDYFPLLVGNHILGGGGMTSRLYDQVRERRGLSYSVYSFFVPYQQPGPFQIGLQTRRDQAQEAVSVVRKVLADFVANGATAAELEAAQQNLIGGFALRIDSNQKILSYLAVIGFYRLPLDYLDTFTARIEAVTLEQVRDAFARHVDSNRLATVVVGAPAAK